MIACLFCRSYRDKTGKMYGLWEMMRPLVSTFILFFLMVFWAQQSSCQVMEQQPRLFYWTTGTAFSNIAVSGNHYRKQWTSFSNVAESGNHRIIDMLDLDQGLSMTLLAEFNILTRYMNKNLKSISASKYITVSVNLKKNTFVLLNCLNSLQIVCYRCWFHN